MPAKRKYIISFRGLNIGKHEYEYMLNDAFFEGLEYAEFHKGEVRVDLRLNKQEVMLTLDFIVRGHVIVPCDRCGDDCKIKIKGEYQLFVKPHGESDITADEDALVLGSKDGELDIAHHLYEYTALSLPVKRVHLKVSQCNQEVIEKLKHIEREEAEEPVDPRWEQLKNLKFNN